MYKWLICGVLKADYGYRVVFLSDGQCSRLNKGWISVATRVAGSARRASWRVDRCYDYPFAGVSYSLPRCVLNWTGWGMCMLEGRKCIVKASK